MKRSKDFHIVFPSLVKNITLIIFIFSLVKAKDILEIDDGLHGSKKKISGQIIQVHLFFFGVHDVL